MKLHTNQNTIVTNVNGANNFSIKTSAKAFKILSDNLYADKYAAVIREYSTNAYDAHVSVGKADLPFEVHLPTYEETYFSVRDFGPGMSEDQIMTLFTTYFDSDKTESNDMVGALGLGSKSAFAYTDAFTVESYNDGMYKMYSLYISQDGTPQITKMLEKESEGSGFIVKFSVDNSDIDEFTKRASKIYRFFKTVPIFTGARVEVPREEKVFTGEGWTISKVNKWSDFSGAFAVQGNIAYPINKDRLTDLDAKHKFVLENSFRIDFTLGDLDVAASREYLSYDKLTIQNIKDKMSVVYDEFYDHVISEVRKTKSAWEATKTFRELITTYELKQAWDYLPIIFNGTPLRKDFELKAHEFKDVTFLEYEHSYQRIKRNDLKKYYSGKTYIPSQNVVFVIQDEESNRIAQNKARSLVSKDKCVTFISKLDQTILDTLGNPEYILSSSIEKPKIKKSNSNKEATKPFIPMKENGFFDRDKAINLNDLGEKVYFVPINRFVPMDGENKVSNSNFSSMIRHAKTLDLLKDDDVIYGVLGWAVKKYAGSDQFINIFNFIHESMDGVISKKKKDVISYRKAGKTIDIFFSKKENKYIYQAWQLGHILISENSPAMTIFNKISSLEKRMARISKNKKFDVVNRIISSKENIEVEADKIDNLADHYPMLSYFGSMASMEYRYTFSGEDKIIIQEYIDGVDGVKR